MQIYIQDLSCHNTIILYNVHTTTATATVSATATMAMTMTMALGTDVEKAGQSYVSGRGH